MSIDELRQCGGMVFTTACRSVGTSSRTRGQVRAAVIAAIKEHGFVGSAATFAGNYAMAQFGYGGGL